MLPILPDFVRDAAYEFLDSIDPSKDRKVDFPVIIKLPSGQEKVVATMHFEYVSGLWHSISLVRWQSEIDQLLAYQKTKINELENPPA